MNLSKHHCRSYTAITPLTTSSVLEGPWRWGGLDVPMPEGGWQRGVYQGHSNGIRSPFLSSQPSKSKVPGCSPRVVVTDLALPIACAYSA